MSVEQTSAVIIISVISFASFWLGEICGMAREYQRTAKAVECMDKIRGMAQWVMDAEKFAGPGAVSSSNGTYQLGDEEFALKVSRIQFEQECG